MLSILIPVYNFDISALVNSLRKELISLDVVYEIRCLDDASTNIAISQKNMEVNSLMHCSYTVQSENQGRSKTRNQLIRSARYDRLIFLDGDVLPVGAQFVTTYIKALDAHKVVYGGLKYPKAEKFNFSLHHRYGSEREAQSLKQRTRGSNLHFSSANFAIQKSCLATIRFDEGIKSYGFEDLVFAKAVVAENWEIVQLDNPVVHWGIELDNNRFLEKEQESLCTLKDLFDNNMLIGKDVKLLRYFNRLKRFGMTRVYRGFYRLFKSKIKRNLLSKKPSLLQFDLYRLGYFIDLYS